MNADTLAALAGKLERAALLSATADRRYALVEIADLKAAAAALAERERERDWRREADRAEVECAKLGAALEDADATLGLLEDVIKGRGGDEITRLRGRILRALRTLRTPESAERELDAEMRVWTDASHSELRRIDERIDALGATPQPSAERIATPAPPGADYLCTDSNGNKWDWGDPVEEDDDDGWDDACCPWPDSDRCCQNLATPQPSAEERERIAAVLRDLLRHVDQQTCVHEETHRGGAIWTICDGCGMKWADDRGGFQPYTEPPAVTAARDLLSVLAADRILAEREP